MAAIVTWQGELFDPSSVAMLEEMELNLGRSLNVAQGSYSNVAASAATHSKGGAVDLSVRGLSDDEIYDTVREGRRVGWAMWYRRTSDGFDSDHIHGIEIGNPNLSDAAARQVTAYKNGRDGLKNNGPDPQAWLGVPVTTWGEYLASQSATNSTRSIQEDDMLVSNSAGGKHKAWYLLHNGTLVLVTAAEAKSWTGAKITIWTTPSWNRMLKANTLI